MDLVDSLIAEARDVRVSSPTSRDDFFLTLAQAIARKSKDPSTQTGAVLVDNRQRLVSVGYNGFPRGVRDLRERYEDRPTKYKMVVHCEANAIIFARRDLTGCTLYTWPFMSCAPCAGLVIQAGIVRCVAPLPTQEQEQRWGADFAISRTLFEEAGVRMEFHDPRTA
jgi:dCMP deaminase